MPGPYLNTGSWKTRVTSNDTTQQEELGVWRFEGGKIYRYVKAAALIPAGEAVQIDYTVAGGSPLLLANQVAALQTTTNVLVLGVAESTLASLNFGWVTCYGPATARVASNAPQGAMLGQSGTTVVTGVLGVWNMSQYGNIAAIAVQTGLSAGSAVFLNTL